MASAPPQNEALRIEGLDEFRRDLRHAADPKAARREFKKADVMIAKEVAPIAAGFARGYGGETAHFAARIRGGATAKGAYLAVNPKGNAAVWGAKKRTGWNARPVKPGAKAQHPPWVGNTWQVGGPGGPRGLNDAIRERSERIVAHYGEAIGHVAAQAFPD